jgi:hypothetical protein
VTAGGFGTGSLSLSNNGTTNPATSNMEAGAFDNQYYNSTGTAGNLYVCENGNLFQIPLTSFTGTVVVNTYNKAVSTVGVAATCSPVTEFLGVKVQTTLSGTISSTTTSVGVASGTNIANNDYIQVDSEIMKVTGGATGAAGAITLTVTRGQQSTTGAMHNSGATTQDIQDWIFTSVEANGNVAGCAGPCVYNYNVIAGATTGTPSDSLAAGTTNGGTSGIIIDTTAPTITGGGEIYYTVLGGTSAVQATQSGLQ